MTDNSPIPIHYIYQIKYVYTKRIDMDFP